MQKVLKFLPFLDIPGKVSVFSGGRFPKSLTLYSLFVNPDQPQMPKMVRIVYDLDSRTRSSSKLQAYILLSRAQSTAVYLVKTIQ